MARTYSELSSSREILAILVETDSHDTISGIESFFHSIAVVHVNVNIEYPLVIAMVP